MSYCVRWRRSSRVVYREFNVRVLHFDCFSGVSGDMILGALIDAGVPLKDLTRQLKQMRAGGYSLQAKKVTRGGLHATKVDVVVRNGFRSPLSLSAIQRAIRASRLPGPVKERSLEVFDRLARAEGIAHRVSAAKVQFHEVGVVDSLVDVVGGVLGCHLLGVDRITASSVNLGSGMIESAHGRLPAPGPAVAALARGLPIYSAGPVRELTTPTGLALLSVLADDYGPLPLMRPSAVGYGAGTADPDGWPNVLRVFLGESRSGSRGDEDTVVQVETNLDDLNPQAYDTVMARLFEAGALDVTLTPVIMKQGRPGIVLTALAPREKAEAMAGVMLRETTTLGVRMQEMRRRVLPRRLQTVRTSGGLIRMKVAETGRVDRKAAPEYRDCRRIAELTGRPVREIMEEAVLSFNRRARGRKRPR
jgi:uncharacterized protein (TIGR00299 family) protein